MPIVIVGSEKNFGQLKARLFAGRVSTKVANEVAAEVAAANPDVDLDHLRPGTVLTIPPLPDVPVRDKVALDDTARETVEAVVRATNEALAALVNVEEAREKTEAAKRKRLATALGSDAVDTAARRDKKLAADVASVRKALEEEEAAAKERLARMRKAQAEWSMGLDALVKLGE